MGAPRIAVIDNYDSFVYNLVQYLGELGADPIVVRNDERDITSLLDEHIDGVLISPGPGRPEHAGITCELITAMSHTTPILGVCLGHQAIGHVFGATVTHAPELRHGKTSLITHDGHGVFANVPSPFEVTRYHSLVVDDANMPDELIVTARTDDGTVMGIRHRHFNVEGVQFHPESILTQHGHALLRNFLDRC